MMFNCELSVHVEDDYIGILDENWLQQVVENTLSNAGIDESICIGLVIAGDETVHKLNQSYRGIDSTTDVLAFAFAESATNIDEQFVTPPNMTGNLGEVIISYPQARKQAKEHNHTIKREVALLVAHGTLHLLGYDHEQVDDDERMRALEAKILDTTGMD
jgi:probable rRNA maturation factor